MAEYGYGTEGFTHSGHGGRSGRPQPWDHLVCLVAGLPLCRGRFFLYASRRHSLLGLGGVRVVGGRSRIVHLLAASQATLGSTPPTVRLEARYYGFTPVALSGFV